MLNRQSAASHQIVDGATVTSGSISGGSFGSGNLGGTIWPLLPNQAIRVYNVGLNISPDSENAPGVFNVQSLCVFASFLDSSQNPVGNQPMLAAQSWANPGALLNGDQAALAIYADGDPLIELASNMLFTQATIQNGPSASFFHIVGAWEVKNIDGSNAHTITANLVAVLSFVTRGI